MTGAGPDDNVDGPAFRGGNHHAGTSIRLPHAAGFHLGSHTLKWPRVDGLQWANPRARSRNGTDRCWATMPLNGPAANGSDCDVP